jgi:RHS repeat-associated protein
MVLDKDATAYTSTGDNYFPLMDRMGNVTGYRSSDNGSSSVLSAVYEYDAFGREMKSTGSASDKMPFRFSTKFTDVESGLVYYGYRYYDPIGGRWLNRDPIGEQGGLGLFTMTRNRGPNIIDVLGLCEDGDVKTESATIVAYNFTGESVLGDPLDEIQEAFKGHFDDAMKEFAEGFEEGSGDGFGKLVSKLMDAEKFLKTVGKIGKAVNSLNHVVSMDIKIKIRCCVCGTWGDPITHFEQVHGTDVPSNSGKGGDLFGLGDIKKVPEAIAKAMFDAARSAHKICAGEIPPRTYDEE